MGHKLSIYACMFMCVGGVFKSVCVWRKKDLGTPTHRATQTEKEEGLTKYPNTKSAECCLSSRNLTS